MAENAERPATNSRNTQSTNLQQSRPHRSSTRPRVSLANQASGTRRPSNRPSRATHPNLYDALPKRPQYSLAGNSLLAQGPSFVDPKYYELNPAYNKLESAPVWGLAKPLPRVVRPGMRRGLVEGQGAVEDKGAQRQEPGSAAAIPQVGMIDDQRHDAGKDQIGQRGDLHDRGYGHHVMERKQSQSGAPAVRVGSENSVIDRYGTPKDERSNPMEEWRSRTRSYGSSHTDPFDDQNADLGARRLSSLQEVLSSPSMISAIGDGNVLDLEAGENSEDWPLDKEDAELYTQEAADGHNLWRSVRAKLRDPLAECLATMIAVLIGLCTNLAVQTSINTAGSYQSTNWAWGLGVTIGIYIAGGISGGHLNPAVSLMLSLYRGFPFRKALIYIAAQIFGAFLAGLIAYGVYRDAILSFDSQGGQTAAEGGIGEVVGLFAGGSGKAFFTQPADFAGVGAGFANEFVATAILACAILALGDDSNAPPGAGMHALIVGLVVTVLTMAFGYNTGACMNPARDFGPRVATAALGYGGQVFTVREAWWIYGAWGATISGALTGGLLYDAAIFVGGESPINYPRSRRRKAKDKAKKKWFGLKKDVERGLRGELGKDG